MGKNDDHLPIEVYRRLANIRYQLRKFIHVIETESRDNGITPQQHQLMLAIKGFPTRDYATISEIAERLQLSHHACVELIDRCEGLELVKRVPNPNDGRSIYVEVTNKGFDILEVISRKHLVEFEKLNFSDL